MKSNLIYHRGRFTLEISFAFLAVLTFMFLFDTGYNAFASVLAIVFHECAHLLSLLLFKGRIKKIRLSLFEMNIAALDGALSRRERIIVALSGPTANILLGLLFWKANREFVCTNFVFGFFQLLPIVTLDGESALCEICENRNLKKGLSLLFSFFTAFLGFAVLLQTKYNFSVLAISLYLIWLTLGGGCNTTKKKV